MQRRLLFKSSTGILRGKFKTKIILFALIFFLAIFFLDKLEMPVPNKLIKQEISNDKLITLR